MEKIHSGKSGNGKIMAPKNIAPQGLLHAEKPLEEDSRDNALRPRNLAEFQGQKEMKSNLSVFIEAARARNESLDHLFLTGPPGLGKTTLAQVVANELGADFKVTSAPALEKPKDLAGILTTITGKAVFFIDEIHRLKPAIEEMLYIAMEDYELDWIIGQGPGARNIRIPIQPFTLVGATTKAGNVSSPLISRFGISCRFSFYNQEDMVAIVKRSAGILNVAVEDDAASHLAKSARGTPRVANRLLRRIRDFAQVKAARAKGHSGDAGQGSNGGAIGPLITMDVVEEGLGRLEIDSLGLERYDREILKIIIERYDGGPVGAETLAISIGESVDTLEDFYEPYLIQAGLLQRTPRGRMVTSLAYDYLELPGHKKSGREKDAGGLFSHGGIFPQ